MTPRQAALDRLGRVAVAFGEAIRDLAAAEALEASKPQAPRPVLVQYQGTAAAAGVALIRPREVARRMGVHVETLRKLRRADPSFPAPVAVPGLSQGIAWRESDVAAYLAARTQDAQDRRTA